MKPALTIIDGYATRKPSDWAEVELLPLSERTEEVLNALRELPVFNPPHDAYEPLEDFPAGYTVIPFDGVARTRFLLTINGEDYYINTEGSNYCRYALRLGTAVKVPADRRREARRRELISTLDSAINKLRVALRNAHDDKLTVKDFENIEAAATDATIAHEDFWNLTK
jgi:hypothetical protein